MVIGSKREQKLSRTIHRNNQNIEKLKNKDKIKEILDATKIIKKQRKYKNLKKILTASTFGENTTQGVTKCNNNRGWPEGSLFNSYYIKV